MNIFLKSSFALFTLALAGTYAHAAPVEWNTWTSATTGTISGPVTVTFSAGGSHDVLVQDYPTYTPTATFADGSVVNNAPTQANGIVQLFGGNNNVNKVTFSTAVVNPVMAIWSLGDSRNTASFNFIDATPTFVSGGQSTEYAGSAISVVGNNVFGTEGNGTVMFKGTYTSISWTNPVYESWYGINVGIASVPEPETYPMLLAGLGLLGFVARRRNQKGA